MIDILLVEDNLEFVNLLEKLLVKRGFSFCFETTGEGALQWLDKQQAKIIILDIMLEKEMDGFDFCANVRKKGNVPILMLSAKADKTDKLMGFSLGADDYMEKPVDLDILIAKIQALLSRYETIQNRVLISNGLTIDLDAHKVFLEQKELELNAKEFSLLVLFVQNKGKTLHKQYIFEQIWGNDSFSEEQTLTVHIKMLRTKIEKDSRNPKMIKTVWGVGYRYEEI